MPKLLQIGPASNVDQARLDATFDVVSAPQNDVTHVYINGHGSVGADLLDQLPNLKMIGSYGVGYDHIDAAACADRSVMVTHTPDVLNEEVASTALLLALACYRELLHDDAYVRSGDWEQLGNAPLTRSLDNQVIGILGMGRIGQAIARKFLPFDPTVLYHTRSPKDVPYEYCADLIDMAARSDVLIVITPGGAATKHLANAEVMNALGPQGTLINVARGSVVDEKAAIAALSEGRLGWAGLDVFEAEPHVPAELCALKNVVLLPHVGSASTATRAAMGKLTVDNIIQHLEQGSVLTAVPECAALN